MPHRFFAAVVAVLACAALSAAERNPAPRHGGVSDAPRMQRVIVQFRGEPGTSRSKAQSTEAGRQRVKALAGRSGLLIQDLRQIGPGQHVLWVGAADGEGNLERLLTRLRADESVEFADPDRRRFAHAVPNDPLYVDQWYWKQAQVSASRFEGAWDVTTGAANMVIAVIDSGVRFEHPDLGRVADGGRLLPGYDFISAESPNEFRVANDGDGWDADPSDPGDWIEASDQQHEVFEDCDITQDGSSWHGTRVAGIIGARTNNAEGIAGGTWSPRILPVRVLGKCGGFDSDILAGMRWAAGLPVQNDEDPVPVNANPARILNMSLGATSECPAAYRDLMEELEERGVLVVVSAGNEVGVAVDSPANCPFALGVAGVRHIN
jgi:serine protease